MCEVEIVMGLSRSGKTRFLNNYIEFTSVKKERTLIIIIGSGNVKLHDKFSTHHFKVKIFDSVFEISEKKLLYILNVYNPHRIIVEGDYSSIEHVFKIMSSSNLRYACILTSRINIINANFICEVSEIKAFKIESNIIVINNYDNISMEYRHVKEIKTKNNSSFLFCVECFDELYFKFKSYGLVRGSFHKNVFRYIKECVDYI